MSFTQVRRDGVDDPAIPMRTLKERFTLESQDYKNMSRLVAAINRHRAMKAISASFLYDEKSKIVTLKCSDIQLELLDDVLSVISSHTSSSSSSPRPKRDTNIIVLSVDNNKNNNNSTGDKDQPPTETDQTVTIPTINFVTSIKMCKALTLQLGFDPQRTTDLFDGDKGSRAADIKHGIPAEMYVYCDLVEPQMVGDTVAPLLKIVNITNSDSPHDSWGTKKTVHFHDPHYVPVMKSTFETVEIDLRDSTGASVPFRYGDTCMKLHLRRTSFN